MKGDGVDVHPGDRVEGLETSGTPNSSSGWMTKGEVFWSVDIRVR